MKEAEEPDRGSVPETMADISGSRISCGEDASIPSDVYMTFPLLYEDMIRGVHERT